MKRKSCLKTKIFKSGGEKRLTSVGRSDPGRKRCGAVFVRFDERTAFEEVDLTRLDILIL